MDNHPDHAGGVRPIVDELHRLALQPVDPTGRDVAEVAARLALLAYSLHARMDRLAAAERLWAIVVALGALGWTVALVLALRD